MWKYFIFCLGKGFSGGLMYLLSFKIVLKALFNNNIYKIQEAIF